MNELEVICAFINHLAQHGEYTELRIERRPDEENRSSPDIDAIAGPFAIEHTSIDTLPDQRLKSARFMSAAGEIEQELKGTLPFRLRISLEYDTVSVGQNWEEIRATLKNWVLVDAPHLPDGKSDISIPNVPFLLHIQKLSERSGGVYFARYEPKDDTLSGRVGRILERKARKLSNYQSPEYTTVLLIESDDTALMNDQKMLEAIQGAFPDGPPQGVDQVWYVDTSILDRPWFREFTAEL